MDRTLSNGCVTQMTEKYTLTILVGSGEVFEGTLDHWQDCFFSFHSEDTGERLKEIMSFCESMEWDLEVQYVKEIK